MNPEIEQLNREVRELRAFINDFVKSDRYTFQKSSVELPATGTKIGMAGTQKLAFFGKTPIVQPSSSGETQDHVEVGGAAVKGNDLFYGQDSVSGTGYTINDIVKHLKALGLLKV